MRTRAVPLGAERLHRINTCARSSSCRRPLWVDFVEEILEQIVGVYRAVGLANNVAFGSRPCENPTGAMVSLAESRGDDEGFCSRGGSPADDAVAGMPCGLGRGRQAVS